METGLHTGDKSHDNNIWGNCHVHVARSGHLPAEIRVVLQLIPAAVHPRLRAC